MFLNYNGFIVGLVMLFATGLGHILVIKGEYYFGTRLWPLFLIIGALCIALSFTVNSILISSTLGIVGVTFLWGIHELLKQQERVKKGWFPENKRR